MVRTSTSILLGPRGASLAAFLLLAPRLAAAQLVLGPVSTPELTAERVTPHEEQKRPALVFGAGAYVAAWWDERTYPIALYVQRLSPEGAFLDPPAVRVAEDLGLGPPVGSGDRQTAAVAFGGGVFLVVWAEASGVVRAVRFDAALRRLDPFPLVVADGSDGPCTAPAVASDGERFWVSFERQPLGSWEACRDVRLVELGPSGGPGSTSSVAADAGLDEGSPRVACNGAPGSGACLVTWQARSCSETALPRAMYATRVDQPGAVKLLLATGSSEWGAPALTAAGDAGFFAAWMERGGSPQKIWGRFVGLDGALSSEDGGVLVAPKAVKNEYYDIGAAWDGEAAVVAYRQGEWPHPLTLARVTPPTDPDGGTPPPTQATLPWSTEHDLALAWGAQSGLLAWQESDEDTLRFSVLRSHDGGFDAGPGTALALSAPEHDHPSLAAGGDGGGLVVWEVRTDAGQVDLLMSLVADDGRLASARGEPLTTRSGDQVAPSVARAGDGWLVAWADEAPRSVLYRRVDASGRLVGVEASEASTGGGEPLSDPGPRVASLADGTALLVYAVREEELEEHALLGLRIGPAGAVIDQPPLRLAGGLAQAPRPAVAASGDGFVVVFAVPQWRPGGDTWTTTVSSLQVPAGGAMNSEAVRLASRQGASRATPAVACRPDGCLVAWRDSYDEVWATVRTDAGSAAGAPVRVSPDGAAEGPPVVITWGDGYLVTWADARSRARHELYGARLDAAGHVLDVAGLNLAPDAPGSIRSQALAPSSGADGRALAAYVAFDPTPGVNASRLQVRALFPASGQGGLTPGLELDTPAVVACGGALRIPSGEGRPAVRGPGPVRWNLELEDADGGALPEGLTVHAETGVVEWKPVPTSPTRLRLRLVAEGAGWIDRQPLAVDVRCTNATFGCGCSTGTVDVAPLLASLWGLSAAVGALRRRRLGRATPPARP